MAKYKVLETFRDKHMKELYEVGEEIEMTVKRAKEAEKNLAKHDKVFLERIEDEKPNVENTGEENISDEKQTENSGEEDKK